ncbi:MAG: glycerol-3-phosphate 1-O-acyltransferase PlsY [Verrucomicrobiota bacterium]|nr:glycerol-3-phosphate 1-O-acyltransferase PlsY [Verrucomicrobiota bacterium]
MLLLGAYVLLIGYLLGSIPFGYLAGKLSGIDVRQHGSGNIGATNVLRVLGKPWGFGVFFADALKGFAAVRIALWLVSVSAVAHESTELFGIFAAIACVAGHSFPVWLRFKGGKGVATSAGSLFGIVPIAATTVFLVWLVVFLTTRYVSVASIAGALALPLVVGVLIRLHMSHSVVLLYFSAAMTALVVWRHRSNISRLLAGTEQRFTRR